MSKLDNAKIYQQSLNELNHLRSKIDTANARKEELSKKIDTLSKKIKENTEKKEMQATGDGKKVNMMKIIPWFIGGFLLLAIINSVGLIPATVSGTMKSASKFLMVTALAAIGLNTSLTDFKKAGLKPMFYGITIDTLVTLTALIVIYCMGLL